MTKLVNPYKMYMVPGEGVYLEGDGRAEFRSPALTGPVRIPKERYFQNPGFAGEEKVAGYDCVVIKQGSSTFYISPDLDGEYLKVVVEGEKKKKVFEAVAVIR